MCLFACADSINAVALPNESLSAWLARNLASATVIHEFLVELKACTPPTKPGEVRGRGPPLPSAFPNKVRSLLARGKHAYGGGAVRAAAAQTCHSFWQCGPMCCS